jgi:hypothetical protein
VEEKSMSIETEHHGYKITYGENTDVWRCWELDVEGKTLSSVKAKIASILSQSRKIDATPAYYIQSWGRVEKITVLSWASPTKVWVMEGKRRAKCSADAIVWMSEETATKLAEARAKESAASALREEAAAIRAAIPRIAPPDGAMFEAEEQTP